MNLSNDTLIAFVSDSHIGGDPGCDGFESPVELEALFERLAKHDGPVELILAGDFFDFLQIGRVPEGMDRASLTISRPEYEGMFAALKRFREMEGNRVIYLPGNHDAESFWNSEIEGTLRERGWLTSSPSTIWLRWRWVEGAGQYTASMGISWTVRIPSRITGTVWIRRSGTMW